MKLTQNLKSYNKYDIFNMFLDFLRGGLDFKESSLEAKVTNLFFEEKCTKYIFFLVWYAIRRWSFTSVFFCSATKYFMRVFRPQYFICFIEEVLSWNN